MQAPQKYRAIHFEQHARTTDVLPPSFEVIPKLLVLLDDPEVNSETIAEIIHADAGLTTNVLRAANTTIFAGSARSESLSQAIMRLGLREIYRLLTTIITSPDLINMDAFGFQRVDLWKHSVACAVGAQILARNAPNQDPEVAYTAALLHDIGKLVMAQVAKPEYIALLESCKTNNMPHFRAEQNAYQIDHAQIGAMLLKRWRFPDELVTAIKGHHEPGNLPTNVAQLTALIYASDIIAYRLNLGSGFPDYAVHPDAQRLEPIGLSVGDLAEYEQEIQSTFQREQKRLS